MKPVDKKDMPKLIALIGLTVCSLGYGIYNLVGGTSYGQAAPAPPAKTEPTPTPVPSTEQVAAAFPLDELKRLEQLPEPVLARDPFITNATPTPGPTPLPAPPAAPPPSLPLPRVKDTVGRATAEKSWNLIEMIRNRTLPSLRVGGKYADRNAVADEASASPSGEKPVVLAKPTPPNTQLTGVLIPEPGEGKSMAILRVEGNPKWVTIGDKLDSNFVVVGIRRTETGSEVVVVDSHDPKNRYTYSMK